MRAYDGLALDRAFSLTIKLCSKAVSSNCARRTVSSCMPLLGASRP
jgi:hypothetical protein